MTTAMTTTTHISAANITIARGGCNDVLLAAFNRAFPTPAPKKKPYNFSFSTVAGAWAFVKKQLKEEGKNIVVTAWDNKELADLEIAAKEKRIAEGDARIKLAQCAQARHKGELSALKAARKRQFPALRGTGKKAIDYSSIPLEELEAELARRQEELTKRAADQTLAAIEAAVKEEVVA